jgi:hypothetical protein
MCFSGPWIEQLVIWIIEVVALIMIIRLVLPWAISFFALPGIVVAILNIVLWAIIAIVGVIIIFDLFSCILSGGGGGFSLMPRVR